MRCEGQTANYFTPSFGTQSCEKNKKWLGEPSAPSVSGAARNLLNLHLMTPRQACWPTPHQRGAKGSHSSPSSHGPTKPSMGYRPWQHPPPLPPVPSRFPISIQSPHRRRAGTKETWWDRPPAPRQTVLVGGRYLQNTLSLTHPLQCSPKTLPEDLPFPHLPWRNLGTQSDPIQPTSGASSFTSLGFSSFSSPSNF